MFCPRCAAPLEKAPPTACTACGVELWRNAKPCAGALVTRSGRLLLVRRSVEPWVGCWDIPGGFCEPHEHPIETAVREVAEETGLAIRITGILGIWLDAYGAGPFGGQQELTLNIYYHAEVGADAEAVADRSEISELGWFEPADLPRELAFPDHESRVLRAWREAWEAGDTASPLRDRPG